VWLLEGEGEQLAFVSACFVEIELDLSYNFNNKTSNI
jgi:hypothetical protein